jgi:hypothetical protein
MPHERIAMREKDGDQIDRDPKRPESIQSRGGQ